MPRLPSYDVSLDVPASPSMSDDEIRATLSKLPNGLMSRTVPARDGPNGARADTNGSNAQSVTASLLAGKPASYKPKKHSANEQSVKLAGPVVAPNAIVPEEVKIEANKRGRQVKEWNWRDDITHHHVWWIIHSITNIVFNCIYWIPLARVSASTFALVNILVGSLCRDTDLIATLHYISPYCPRFGRYHILRMLHCIGGLHVAANLWCYYWVWVYVLNEIILPQWLWDTVSYPWFITFTAVPLPITMTLIICTAFPAMRRKHHDLFEMNHRYTRFTMFAFIFVHIILRNIYVNNGNWNVANTYLVFTLLALAIYPWTLVRKAPINHIYMSGANHVVITYGRKMPAHGFVRISSDLNEWHSFGIAYVDEAKKEFDLVITRAGDWTSKLLDACAKGPGFAPTYHWVRRRGVGFSYTLYAWNRVLLVGTGGGIAASIGYRKPHYPWCQVWILWIATKHEQVFGPKYWELVKEFGEDHYFAWDSKKMGRPGVVMPVELAKKVQAEAVYIVSNEQYTVELRRACMDAGIPAFGAVWDS
ncbi:hypothetical protein DFJ74DRAFT_60678 [Hyaloraphidium curvatum]|nr:hypothetical protein DFJ74DRAFT_60678 [Hyaloraphidium curvatum]